MKLPDVLLRMLGREIAKPEIERADRVLDSIEEIKVTVVPKNARARAELRRLDGHARR